METLFTISVMLTVAITIILSRSLHRQTQRADRAEAALARVETVIREVQP